MHSKNIGKQHQEEHNVLSKYVTLILKQHGL